MAKGASRACYRTGKRSGAARRLAAMAVITCLLAGKTLGGGPHPDCCSFCGQTSRGGAGKYFVMENILVRHVFSGWPSGKAPTRVGLVKEVSDYHPENDSRRLQPTRSLMGAGPNNVRAPYKARPDRRRCLAGPDIRKETPAAGQTAAEKHLSLPGDIQSVGRWHGLFFSRTPRDTHFPDLFDIPPPRGPVGQ